MRVGSGWYARRLLQFSRDNPLQITLWVFLFLFMAALYPIQLAIYEGYDIGGSPTSEGTIPLADESTFFNTTFSSTGYTGEGESSTGVLSEVVNGTGTVSFVLTWVDDYGENDLFELSIEGTEEGRLVERSSSGRIEIIFVGLVDNPEWAYEITAINCPGIIDNPYGDQDIGNEWSLTINMSVEEVA